MLGVSAVPSYYCSLSLQALQRIRNNFNESKYQWIEKYIHIITWSIPCVIAIVLAVTENFNPYANGCWITKYPKGCGTGPGDIPCERGNNVNELSIIVCISVFCLYWVVPPSIMFFMFCRIQQMKNKIEESQGMQRIRGSAEKEMMHSIAKQMSLYLFSFWVTCLPGLIHIFYQNKTGEILYWLSTLGNCLFAFQGFVFALVYFASQRLGKPTVVSLPAATPRPGLGRRQPTVRDIRENARLSALNMQIADDSERRGSSSSCAFSIFDGTPDEDSPWAKFIDEDDDCNNSEPVELELPTNIPEEK